MCLFLLQYLSINLSIHFFSYSHVLLFYLTVYECIYLFLHNFIYAYIYLNLPLFLQKRIPIMIASIVQTEVEVYIFDKRL